DRDTNEAIRFVKEFGAFDFLEVTDRGFDHPTIPPRIQEFCKTCIKPRPGKERRNPFATPLDDFWSVRNDIFGLWNLAMSIRSKDENSLRTECIRRRPGSNFDPPTDWLAVGKAILSADLSASLNPGKHQPRILLHDKEGQFVALTLCRTVRSALYL